MIDEIRVIEKAVWVFENVVYENRSDRLTKLDRFRREREDVKQRKKTAT